MKRRSAHPEDTRPDKPGRHYPQVQWRGRRHALHRLIAAEALGRPLEPGEVVHHQDGDRGNYLPGNLVVLPGQAEHAALHGFVRREGRGVAHLFGLEVYLATLDRAAGGMALEVGRMPQRSAPPEPWPVVSRSGLPPVPLFGPHELHVPMVRSSFISAERVRAEGWQPALPLFPVGQEEGGGDTLPLPGEPFPLEVVVIELGASND